MLQEEHSAILSTFIRLPFVIKIFVWSFFEWPLKKGFTVLNVIGNLPVVSLFCGFGISVTSLRKVSSKLVDNLLISVSETVKEE